MGMSRCVRWLLGKCSLELIPVVASSGDSTIFLHGCTPHMKLIWILHRAVRTYESSGMNGAPAAEIVTSLDQDTTTPGYVRIPVCGAVEAFKNWKNAASQSTRSSTFPCNERR